MGDGVAAPSPGREPAGWQGAKQGRKVKKEGKPVDTNTIIIMILVSFILGMVLGVMLARPTIVT